jgi:hypothetical protein
MTMAASSTAARKKTMIRPDVTFGFAMMSQADQEISDEIKTACRELAELIEEKCPGGNISGPEKTLALRKLQECCFYAGASIAHGPYND